MKNSKCRDRVYSPSPKCVGSWPTEPNTINCKECVEELGTNEFDNGLYGFGGWSSKNKEGKVESLRHPRRCNLYKLFTIEYKSNLDCYSVLSLSLYFPIPFSWRGFHLIYLNLDHLHLPLIDHLSPYSSTCPIKHPLWFSLSCGSQDSIVQRYSSHKCDQKSSCSAFNVVVTAFP